MSASGYSVVGGGVWPASVRALLATRPAPSTVSIPTSASYSITEDDALEATTTATTTTSATAKATATAATSATKAATKATAPTTATASEPTTAAAATTATATGTTTTTASTGRTGGLLGLFCESAQREQLVRADEDLVAGLERRGCDTGVRLDREHDVVDRAEDLVDLANLGLVLEVGTGVKVRHLVVRALVDHLVLTRVHKGTQLDNRRWRSLWLAATATAEATAATTTTATATEATASAATATPHSASTSRHRSSCANAWSCGHPIGSNQS